MSDEQVILKNDLMILEAMAENMKNYLVSDAKSFTLPRVNMPKLTIGGYLMRQDRLTAVEAKLTNGDRTRLMAARGKFDAALIEKVVRFETRTHQELRMRISEWSGYLRDLTSKVAADKHHYSGIVDIRVVIESMMKKLQTDPYRLEDQIVRGMDSFDKKLRTCWQVGDFLWEPVWQAAYPQETYWYLYGQPEIGC